MSCGVCGQDHPSPREDDAPDSMCPPCQCHWCRYNRGEATPEERRWVEANIRAHELSEERRKAREFSRSLGAALARHKAQQSTNIDMEG
jgi:hypothetical protein